MLATIMSYDVLLCSCPVVLSYKFHRHTLLIRENIHFFRESISTFTFSCPVVLSYKFHRHTLLIRENIHSLESQSLHLLFLVQ